METEKNSEKRRRGLSTISLMICTLVSRLLGYVKIAIISSVFGATGMADVLNAAFTVPNNLRKLTAEGALSSSFIPVLAGSIANKEDPAVTRNIVRNLLGLQFVLIVPICIVCIIYADSLATKVFFSFRDPELQVLAVSLLRWFISYTLLISVSAVLLAVLNVHNYFTVPALTPILFSISVIISILCLHRYMGVYSMVVGVLAGGLLQVLFQCPLFKKLGYDFRPSFDFKDKKFLGILLNWFPVAATSSIFFINQQISIRFASGLETGSSSAISYALVFFQFPYGMFANSITSVLFPQMSKEGATGQHKELADTFTSGVIALMGLLIPSSVIMYFLGYDIISIGLQRGSFDVNGTALTAFVLQGYVWGLLGTSTFSLIQKYYYSLNNYRKPIIFALLCAVIDVCLSLWLKETPLRAAGLAWANTISLTLGSLIMLADIRLHSKAISIRRILRQLIKIVAAVCAGLLPVYGYLHFFGTWWQGGISFKYIIAFLTVCAVFACTVLALYKVLKLDALFMMRLPKWLSRKRG